ncbi:hypothetical protein HHE014_06050 [Helicobacter heilmannii]|nr:hypothetical protein HHE014_06050 [Helicobacter heilmannii]
MILFFAKYALLPLDEKNKGYPLLWCAHTDSNRISYPPL